MSLILDGVSQYADLTFASAFDSTGVDMSLFCWVKSAQSASYAPFFGIHAHGSGYGMVALRRDDNDYIDARFRPSSIEVLATSAQKTSGEYKKCLLVWDAGLESLSVYVDGETPITVSGSPNHTFLRILCVGCQFGAANGGTPNSFIEGSIAHAAYWQGTALGGADITDLMAGTKKPDQLSVLPTHYKPLVNDQTGGIGADYTLYNSAVIDSEDPYVVPTTTETLDNVTLEPAAGKQYVTIGATPDLTYKSLLYDTDPAADNPDQLESDTLTSDGKAITLNTDGTFSIANVGTNVQTFNYRVYDMDGAGWSAMATATVTPQAGEPDTTKPNIEIIGSSTVFVDIGDTFTDQGALVTDNVDANTTIYSNVTVTTASVNTFTLPYDYTDGADNVADTAYRTVVVFDPNEVVEALTDTGVIRPIIRQIISTIIK